MAVSPVARREHPTCFFGERFLIRGLYNKLVKQLGSDFTDRARVNGQENS
jgi:hypothetical protein